MNDSSNADSLSTPLFGLLGSLGHSRFHWYHHFEMGTLFWSLTRLFGFYHRIIVECRSSEYQRALLESDIESFIIRMRIVLNDAAFIIRQILPDQVRGLKGPKGGVHPRNKEMSMMDLLSYADKNPWDYPDFVHVLKKNKEWMCILKEQRDNIIHYKSKVILLETKPHVSFAILNAAGTEKTVKTVDGGRRLVTIPVFGHINSQMLSLHTFLQVDLVNAIEGHLKRQGVGIKSVGSDPRMTCMGIALFKQINNITYPDRIQ